MKQHRINRVSGKSAAVALGLAVIMAFAPTSAFAAAGDLDPTFGSGGKVITAIGEYDEAHALILQPDGKLVAAGHSTASNRQDFGLARYNSDGTLDTTFGAGGTIRTNIGNVNDNNYAYDLVLQPDGKLVAAGSDLVRYNNDGTLDGAFGNGGKVAAPLLASPARAAALQPDGKIVVAGYAIASGIIGVGRYNADGTADTSFGSGGAVTTSPTAGGSRADDVLIQPNGRIVVAGYSYGTDGNQFTLVRYNANGSLDSSFGIGGIVRSPGADAYALILQADGKLVAAGTRSNHFSLMRYNSNGTIDSTFGTAGNVITPIGMYSIAYALILQADGKLVAAGYSHDATSYDDFALVRYNSNGTIDSTFGAAGIVTTVFGTSIDNARDLVLQPADGKLVAAGYSYNGLNQRFALARYESAAAVATATPSPSSTSESSTATPTHTLTAAPAPTCPATPLADSCRGAAKVSIAIKNSTTDDSRDKLSWKWSKGDSTDLLDLGDPRSTTSYTLCAYDARGPLFSAAIPAGGMCGARACWRASGAKTFKYKDRTGANGGVQALTLTGGDTGRAKISLKGKGMNLPDPALPCTQPVILQLFNSDGQCWEAIYTAPARRNDLAGFTAREG